MTEDPVSLESPVGDGESSSPTWWRTPPPADRTTRWRAASAKQLLETLGGLNDRTRHVLEARFGLGDREPATLEQVGIEIGVTRERVRQIETRALRELEKRNPSLRDFLRGHE